jgi:hypothetical protein
VWIISWRAGKGYDTSLENLFTFKNIMKLCGRKNTCQRSAKEREAMRVE